MYLFLALPTLFRASSPLSPSISAALANRTARNSVCRSCYSNMASRKRRSKTILPPPQPGQLLISSYFSPKNVSEVRGKENTRESSSGESSQTASKASRLMEPTLMETSTRNSVVAVTTIAKPTSASGTRKNNGVSSRKKSSKHVKKQSERVDKFSQLTEEILQNIFCQLPIADLRSCALVCQQWRRIISNDSVSNLLYLYVAHLKKCRE